MSRLPASECYCTDEDLYVAAPGDFAQLAPASQVIARGADGVTTLGAWTLTSTAVNFQTQGVALGHVVQLTGPANVYKSPDLLVVQSVSTTTATLRRAGLTAGIGQTPPTATAVVFVVSTLYPQIERASYDLNRRLGIDANVGGRGYSDLYDPRELQGATVALVLSRQYRDMARHAGNSDDFTAKAKSHMADFERIVLRIDQLLKDAIERRDEPPLRTLRLSR